MKNILNFYAWLSENEERNDFYKKELDQLFWKKTIEDLPDDTEASNYRFDSDIRKKLLQLAEDFYSSLGFDPEIKDIQLTGSLANYNWTDKSDLDVHVLIDFREIDENFTLVKKAVDGMRFIWNLRHKIKIKGYDVELYLQDINEPHTSSGLYSLLNNEWIRVPKYNPPQIDERDVQLKFEGIVNDINQLNVQLQNPTPEMDPRDLYNHSEKVKSKIMKMRKEGLAERGEFSVENLVFKKLRNEGYIQNLIDLISRSYEKIYNE